MNSGVTAVATVGFRPPFTAAQWQELEHQALIFKYLMARVPVPPELLVPIRRSFEAMNSRYYHYPALSYCYYGKKLDPEPGRCRRTDGKKWRCSKDAYPDSKYCERHMHRGRNRSRKLVETQTLFQSQSSSSSSVSATAAAMPAAFHSLPMLSFTMSGEGSKNPQSSYNSARSTSSHQLHVDPFYYGIENKDFRCFQGVKSDIDEHIFFSEASGSARGSAMDSALDVSFRPMPSQLHSLHTYQQNSLFKNDFASPERVKNESHSLRPFFDEWPRTRESWSDLEDDQSNRASYSTTQLSISIPMTSSDFSNTSSRSANSNT